MTNKFQPIEKILQSEDVIDCSSNGNVRLFKDFFQYVKDVFSGPLMVELYSNLRRKGIDFSKNIHQSPQLGTEGVECRVLRTNGNGWQNAKVRFRIIMEIELEDSSQNSDFAETSPLDDIRQSINNSEEA